MMSIQRMQMVLGCQVLIVLCVGSFVWSRQLPDDYDMRRLYYAYKRYPGYDFGLGKRSLEEAASYEDTGYYAPSSYSSSSSSSAPSYPLLDNNQGGFMDKRASPQGMYSFGLGKRNQRVYAFGLGKRLEHAFRSMAPPSSALFPYRQERRSKIYSFGLGKRSSDFQEDDYEYPGVSSATGSANAAAAADKRSQARQFSFGLGKRDTEPSEHNVKSTSS